MIDPTLPGADLVEKGIADLDRGEPTIEAWLVSIGAVRIRDASGIDLRGALVEPEAGLYAALARENEDSAHSRYNALVRRLVSFERVLECASEPVDAGAIHRLLRAFAAHARAEVRVYLTGGATAVLEGWRASTRDVDFKMEPDDPGIFDAIPEIKEELRINLEIASPDDFVPALPGWGDRSRFVASEGLVSFFHYDFYAQALAKLERAHPVDLVDVAEMLSRGMIEPEKLRGFFDAIEPNLNRYPVIDPKTFRGRVEEFLGSSRTVGGAS